VLIMDKKRKHQQCSQSVSVIVPTSCQKCGSTERSPYHSTVKLQGGVTWMSLPGVSEGTPYVELRKSYTTCLKCGQNRIDQQFVFDPNVCGMRKTKEEITG
jgi:hypothetical protein